ncbi:MAG TPA: DUF1583 domain-containing protein, partial [Gemmataceae bacterium]
SLQERLDRVGPLEVAEIVRIGFQTASGLAAAHAQGLIHRDIKPANLLLENGLARVKITDFGLARLTDDVGLTQNGVVAGTPEYMAPEQACGKAVDHRADLFSLGSVLYACCTGVPPFRASTALAVLSRVSEKEPASIRSFNPEVPAWLEAFIARLMAKDPAQRFPSATEVVQLLEGYLAHLRQPMAARAPEVPSLPGSTLEKFAPLSWFRFAPQLPLWGWLSVLAALVVLGLGISFWFRAGVQWEMSRHELALQERQAGDTADNPRKQDHLGVDLATGIGKLPPALYLFGPDAESVVQTDLQGWRFTLPAGRSDPNTVGLKVARRLSGDFTITLGYELLAVGEPLPRWGAGVAMRVTLDASSSPDPLLSLSKRPEGPMFTAQKVLKESNGEEKYFDGVNRKATQSRGKLRLVRIGSQLRYLVAEEGQDFRIIHTAKIETADVQEVQFHCHTTYTPIALDVRWTELNIRADWIEGQNPRPAVEPRSSEDDAGKTRTRIASAASPKFQVHFHQDLRSADLKNSLLHPIDEKVRLEAAGVRVTLPADQDVPEPSGLSTNATIHGDFEITGSFEILKADRPSTGYGVGVGLYAAIDADTNHAVSLARRLMPDGTTQFVSDRMIPTKDGLHHHPVKTLPSKAAAGKLRLQRVGSRIRFLVAEEGQSDFVLIDDVEFSAEDIHLFKFEGNTGGARSSLDCRLLDFVLRAEQVVDPALTPARADSGKDGGGRPHQHLAFDFRKGIHNFSALSLEGPDDADKLVKTDAQGLRVTLPAGRADTRPVIVALEKRLRGNFEITLGYELIAIGEPVPRYGAGVTMRLWFDAPTFLSAILSRNQSEWGNVFAAHKIIKDSEGKEKYLDNVVKKTHQSRGKLRLARIGSRLHYLRAEEEQDFRVMHSVEIGTADVHKAQFLCTTTYTPIALDVRLTKLVIDADQLLSDLGP